MLATLSLLLTAAAGWGTFHGDTGWDDKKFLLVAEVSGPVRLIDEESNLYEARVRPIATFAGTFDPTAVEYLDIWVPVINPMGRPVTRVPKEDTFILAVILHRFDGRYIVNGGNTHTFMPRGAPMVVVDGLGDPDVARTVAEVHRRRALPPMSRAEADKRWVTSWRSDPDAAFEEGGAVPFRGAEEPATRPERDGGEWSPEQRRAKAATRPVREVSDVERLTVGLRNPEQEQASLATRLEVAATTKEIKALRMLATVYQPFEVQLLVILNPHTPIDIVEAYEHSENPRLKSAAEWVLMSRSEATTRPATQPSQ